MSFWIIPVKSSTTYEWTRDSEFNYGDQYWYPQLGYWSWSTGQWTPLSTSATDYVRFERDNSDHVAHLSIDSDVPFGTTAVAKAVQGWVWGNKPDRVYQPTPLHLSSRITELKVNVVITWSTISTCWWCVGSEAAVLVDVWFIIDNIDVYVNEEWHHYDTAIFGADLYFLHAGSVLPDHSVRESGYSNGLPVLVYTRYFQNSASGSFTIDLISEVLVDANNHNVYFNLNDVTLQEIDAAVEEYSGFAEAKFSRLKVYYTVSDTSGACPTLDVYSNNTWVTEGIMDIHTGAYSGDVIYHHYIVANPELVKGRFYLLKLSELDEHTSYVDTVKLIAVNDNGSAIYLPLVIAIDKNNNTVTRLLLRSDDTYLVLEPDHEAYLLFYYHSVLGSSWKFVFILEGHNPKGST